MKRLLPIAFFVSLCSIAILLSFLGHDQEQEAFSSEISGEWIWLASFEGRARAHGIDEAKLEYMIENLKDAFDHGTTQEIQGAQLDANCWLNLEIYKKENPLSL